MADLNDPKNRVVGRDTIRSRLVLEVASELVDQPQWRYRQTRVNLREQGGDGWPIALFGSDSPAAIAQISKPRGFVGDADGILKSERVGHGHDRAEVHGAGVQA